MSLKDDKQQNTQMELWFPCGPLLTYPQVCNTHRKPISAPKRLGFAATSSSVAEAQRNSPSDSRSCTDSFSGPFQSLQSTARGPLPLRAIHLQLSMHAPFPMNREQRSLLCKGDYDDGGPYSVGFGGATVDRRRPREPIGARKHALSFA
jgi:hypothetical protein